MRTGVVLSGGSSTRFGGEKGLALFRDEPMVCLVVKIMEKVVDEVVVAVAKGRSDDYRRLLDEDVIVVEDDREGIGPLLGLVTAIKAGRGEYVAVSPCDTPLLRSEVVSLVLERGAGKDGAVPMIGGYLEPLHASYRRDVCLAAFEQTIHAGKRRPKDAYPFLDLVTVDEDTIRRVDPDLRSFANVNTREQLAALRGASSH